MTPLSSATDTRAASQGVMSISSTGGGMIISHTNPSSQQQQQQQQQPPQPLRPAAYIQVIDLAQSYNIDAEKIKVEIEKINTAKNEADTNANASASAVTTAPSEGKDDSHSLVSKVTEDSETSGDKKQRGAGMAKGYPKRFSAMNGGFNLCLLVGKVEVVVDKLRVDKSRVRLAEVEVGDETGCISLRARDDQIDELEKVSKEGGAIVLRNSSIELYQGKHLRLAVTKWGKIRVYPDDIPSTPSPPTAINIDLNLSIVDLNLVPPDVWIQHPSTSPVSHKSGETGSRQGNISIKQNQSNQHHGHGHGNQQYRGKKGRGHHHDRRNQSQQQQHAYLTHDTTKIPRMQDQTYNPMLGMTQNFLTSFPPMYTGTQYYSSYEDPQMQVAHQRQRLEQQNQRSDQQQFLLMQQQNIQLQRQMEQMNHMLYNQGRGQQQQQQQPIDQSAQAQPSPGNFGKPHSGNLNTNISLPPQAGLLGQQISPEQNLLHQQPPPPPPPHMGNQSSSGIILDQKNRLDSWPTPTNNQGSPMTMEVPMSPQMNPLAASFAPHYSIPDIGSAMHHSQQQYYLQPQQGGTYTPTPYTHPSPYVHSPNTIPFSQDIGKQSENEQHPGENI